MNRGGLAVRIRQERPIPLDVEFEVARGEVLALVGPSGSGKSSTLRTIAGLNSVSEGAISCNGVPWFDSATGVRRSPRSRRVGLVFQSYALFPHLTALENVQEAMTDRPPVQRIAAARELLALVHMEGLEERRPAELSGGQQQRVAVARALARNPDVLLLDEPFSAVDRMTRIRLQRELAELRRDLAIPTVLVTHDLEEAARLADRIAVLHRGQTLQVGGFTEVMTRPATATVARLVGIRNVFPGVVSDALTPGGKVILQWEGHPIETAIKASCPPLTPVTWCIPGDSVILHRRDRPSRGEHENAIRACVTDAVALGELTEITAAVGGRDGAPLHCAIPTHVARRNGIEAGAEIGLSLRADAIHIMPAADRDRGE